MTFARQVTALSLIGVLGFVGIRSGEGGWEAVDRIFLLCLFGATVSTLIMFGFFGKVR
jgi:hypothetical protein